MTLILQGTLRLDFGGVTTVTRIGVDDEHTDNATDEYENYDNCPFDKDMLNVEFRYNDLYEQSVHLKNRFIGTRAHLEFWHIKLSLANTSLFCQ